MREKLEIFRVLVSWNAMHWSEVMRDGSFCEIGIYCQAFVVW